MSKKVKEWETPKMPDATPEVPNEWMTPMGPDATPEIPKEWTKVVGPDATPKPMKPDDYKGEIVMKKGSKIKVKKNLTGIRHKDEGSEMSM